MTIAFCFLAALCEGFDVQVAGVAAGGIAKAFKPSPHDLGYFFAASNLGLTIGAVFGGRLSDRIGRKAVLVGSLVVFGLFSLACSQASDVKSLIWMRLFTGLGLGGAMPNGIALAADAAGGHTPRHRDIALAYTGLPLGGAVVSLVALVTPHEAWRRLFIAGGTVPLIAALAMAFMMPSPPRQPDRDADAGVAGLAAYRALFADGAALRTLVLWAGLFVSNLTLHLLLNWLPLLMQWRGVPKAPATTAQIGFGIGGAVVGFLAGYLLDTPWRRAGLIAIVGGLPILLLLLARLPVGATLMVGLALLLGGCVIASQGLLYALAGSGYGKAVRGAGVGAALGLGRLGSIAGPLLAAALLTAGGSPGDVVIGLLPIVAVSGACILFLGWRPRPMPGGA